MKVGTTWTLTACFSWKVVPLGSCSFFLHSWYKLSDFHGEIGVEIVFFWFSSGYRCFRRTCCLHHQDVESACSSKSSVRIYRTTGCVSPVWTIKAFNICFYLQAPQGPFGQSQQLSNNPSTVLISSTSNSLMSASVKPSTQQIGAIGTKGGGPYQQSALPSAPQPSQVCGNISCTILAIIISVALSHKSFFISHSLFRYIFSQNLPSDGNPPWFKVFPYLVFSSN